MMKSELEQKPEMLLKDRGTYHTNENLECCWNCTFSFQRMGLTLLCKNDKEWTKETSVQPTGKCDSFCSRRSVLEIKAEG